MIIYSIGHSNKPASVMIDKLVEEGVQTLIDCRKNPRSRMWPQFNAGQLEHHLNNSGIEYEQKGDHFGYSGWGGAQDRITHIDEVMERAENGEKIALMCAEADYKKCHRTTELAPLFLKRGAVIKHLIPGKVDVTVTPESLVEQGTLL